MTKTVIETARTEELIHQLGCDQHDPVAGAGWGATYTVSDPIGFFRDREARLEPRLAGRPHVRAAGVVPLFWPLLAAARAVEILANRLTLAPHSALQRPERKSSARGGAGG